MEFANPSAARPAAQTNSGPRSGDHKNDWIRRLELLCQRRKSHDKQQQKKQDQLCCVNPVVILQNSAGTLNPVLATMLQAAQQ
jgi:hypothetical protein